MSDEKLSDRISRVQDRIQEKLSAVGTALARELADLKDAAKPAAPGGVDPAGLLAIVQRFSAASTQVELLNLLVDSVADYVPRVLLLIRKGAHVHGWAGHGFGSEFQSGRLKRVRWEVDSYPECKRVIGDGEALIANFSDLSDLSDQISAFDGFVPLKSCFYPVLVKGKVAAILYCDTGSDPQLQYAEMAEVLTHLAGVELTLVVSKLKAKPAAEAKPAPAPSPSPSRAPEPAAMHVPDTAPQTSFQVSAEPAPNEDDPNIKKARRVARVLVSDLKLYNEDAVAAARNNGDLYQRLREDLDRSYKHYQERVSNLLPNNNVNYFKDEIIRQLAEGNPNMLGPLPF